ncbi:glycosyltransferase family 4 protein [Hathewaya histolytica]|uniref:glycosyltransferase family 4 protein n=1 Tax=Hathewaya histolytica TaxID=1498 RepID=UPI003B6716CA
MKKNVYMITTLFYPSIGGVENHVYNLSKELVKNGIRVKIINPVINLGKNEVYDLDGIEVHKITVGNDEDQERYLKYKSKSKQNLLGFFNGYKRKYYYNKFSDYVYEYILKNIQLEKPDKFILHQHDFISSIKLSKKLSKSYNVIFTNHTGEFLFLKKLPFSKLIIKNLTNHFKFILAPSNELADFKGIRKEDTYSFLSNGVDVERFSPITEMKKNNLRNKYGIQSNKMVIFCPRRWAPTKGVMYLVKAINILVNDLGRKDFLFIFAGNDYKDYPEYKNEIMDFISYKKLNDYIKLQGDVSYNKINELMKISDIIAIPSLMEAVSLAALEGMACGKIVIGTNVGGFLQIISNGKNGFRVDSKNEIQLSKVIDKICDNLLEYRYIGENAREFVEKKYSWDFIAEKTLDIYEKLWN